jgi:PAS domain S-box-containing protein
MERAEKTPGSGSGPEPVSLIRIPRGQETFPHDRSETEERIAADRRRRQILRQGTAGSPLPKAARDPQLVNAAVSALCEGVRDYAIFIMDARGVIVYWGMGAHLMKWWTDEEAVGAHLRLLYPEGGSEDGLAEQHLADAAMHGESVGQGQRVRRGGSTFWAHITLTALRNPQDELIGFAKVTQDLTRRRATEAAVALANEAQSTREAALETAEQARAALQRAEDARRLAEAARERAEEAAALARRQAIDAEEHITKVLGPALEAEQARRASLGIELDAYMQVFASRERGEDHEGGHQNG